MGASAKIDMVAIEKFLATDSATWTALMEAGKKAVEYWKSEAPVGDKEHTLKGGFVVKPGDYKNSIRARMTHEGTRRFIRVQAHDFKANWIEHGVRGKPGSAPCAKTRAYMLGQPGFSSASEASR